VASKPFLKPLSPFLGPLTLQPPCVFYNCQVESCLVGLKEWREDADLKALQGIQEELVQQVKPVGQRAEGNF
jgi:hypothetical protein